jgi:hypothetical protein
MQSAILSDAFTNLLVILSNQEFFFIELPTQLDSFVPKRLNLSMQSFFIGYWRLGCKVILFKNVCQTSARLKCLPKWVGYSLLESRLLIDLLLLGNLVLKQLYLLLVFQSFLLPVITPLVLLFELFSQWFENLLVLEDCSAHLQHLLF